MKFVKKSMLLVAATFLIAASTSISAVENGVSETDNTFLEDLERRAFLFFWEHSSNVTGLTLDRARTTGEVHSPIASIAATGFALTSYCIAAERQWITTAEALTRTRTTLEFFADRAFHINGWFYHWLDQASGERRWESEISSIDTALLLGGVLTVRQCFANDTNIVQLATRIYERVNFQWMMNNHSDWLSHGWKPENGFLASRWTDYSEQTMLNLMAIGSPTFPVPWQTWYTLKRPYVTYANYTYMAAVPPLFIHQFSHAFFDFRGKRESVPNITNFTVNYFENSVSATLAQRQFFIDVLSKKFPKSYNANVWGLTASDSASGYKAWGAPPEDPDTDGTVVPCAAAGSLMFVRDVTLDALQTMKREFSHTYGKYGFADSFNPTTNWTNSDVLGIDVGITLLSAENARTGKVWEWFMRNPEARSALRHVYLLDEATTGGASGQTRISTAVQFIQFFLFLCLLLR